MDSLFCLKCCFSNTTKSVPVVYSNIELDSDYMGNEVVLLKNSKRICGAGGALTTAPLVQSKSYFEVKIQQNGYWAIGLASKSSNLNSSRGGSDAYSWCLCSDNAIRHNDQEISRVNSVAAEPHINSFTDETKLIPHDTQGIESIDTSSNATTSNFPAEGDTIGVTYDHVELNFYLNGKNLEVPTLNVKGTVFPVVYVDDGAILDIVLDNFAFGPPYGFNAIMLEQSIL
ncbi:SPRYD7 family protein [Megaselia abdita]